MGGAERAGERLPAVPRRWLREVAPHQGWPVADGPGPVRYQAEIDASHSRLGLAVARGSCVERGRHDTYGRTAMAEDWNSGIIAEFRANDGKVGGPFKGAPLLLLHTTGARTGQERVNPVMYRTNGGRLLAVATKAGAHPNPDCFQNLPPQTRAPVDDETQ